MNSCNFRHIDKRVLLRIECIAIIAKWMASELLSMTACSRVTFTTARSRWVATSMLSFAQT